MKYKYITTDWRPGEATARVLARHESEPASDNDEVLELVVRPVGSPREPVSGELLSVWMDGSTPYALFPTTTATISEVYERCSRVGRFPADRP